MYEIDDRFFDWDNGKELLNIRKHGVSFMEAATVFKDPNAAYLDDIEHSQYEERFIVIGTSGNSRTLTVCHCYRGNDEVIRIISARRATRTEGRLYGGGK